MTERTREQVLTDLPLYGLQDEADLEQCGCDICRSLIDELERAKETV